MTGSVPLILPAMLSDWGTNMDKITRAEKLADYLLAIGLSFVFLCLALAYFDILIY